MTLEEILKKDKTNDVLWAWSPDKGVYINRKEILDSILAKYREKNLNQEMNVNAEGLSSDENG